MNNGMMEQVVALVPPQRTTALLPPPHGVRTVGRTEVAEILFLTDNGMCVGIRASDARLLERVAASAPPTWQRRRSGTVDQSFSLLVVQGREEAAGRSDLYQLAVGPDVRFASPDLDTVLDALESELHAYGALRAQQHLYVHAGVVGWRGRAVLIPGRSLSGKSTLVAALVRAGASYYSDEYAVLDAAGWVHPYPKRISLRRVAGGRPTKTTAAALGGRTGRRALPVGLVAVTHYRPGASWQPRPQTQGQALLALLDNTLLARIRPAFALATLTAAVAHTDAVQSERAEVDEVVRALLQPWPSPGRSC
jgi:hypothetical protein